MYLISIRNDMFLMVIYYNCYYGLFELVGSFLEENCVTQKNFMNTNGEDKRIRDKLSVAWIMQRVLVVLQMTGINVEVCT